MVTFNSSNMLLYYHNAELYEAYVGLNKLYPVTKYEQVTINHTSSDNAVTSFNTTIGICPELKIKPYVEYIESTGAEYINTGYVAKTEDYRIKCKFEAKELSSNAVLFGGGSDTDVISIILNNPLKIYCGGGSVLNNTIYIDNDTTYEIDAHANNGTLTISINGDTHSTSYTGTINKEYALSLFGNNVTGSTSMLSKVKLYSCLIYDGGELVRDYVPIKSINGIQGLFDRVTKTNTYLTEEPEFRYFELEYIESTGTQYIDTKFMPNSDTKVIVDVVFPTKPTDHAALFGSREANTNQFWAYYRYSASAYSIRYNSVSDKTLSYDATQRALITMDKNVLHVNDSSVSSTEGTFSTNYPLVIFATNNAGTIQYYSSCKMYSCQIYDNGTLIRDYIPVLRSDGVAGLYDKCEHIFYTSSGTDQFVAGYPQVITQIESSVTYKIPYNNLVRVIPGDIANYTTPDRQLYITGLPYYIIDLEYLPQLGVFIQDVNGKLWTNDQWDDSVEPNGVAIIDQDHSFVISLYDVSENNWGYVEYELPSDAVTTTLDIDEAIVDYNGEANTRGMIDEGEPDSAAFDCYIYTFPNGKIGYLGAAGEWYKVILYIDDVKQILSKLSGDRINLHNYQTSTQVDSDYAWLCRMYNNSISQLLKNYTVIVRPFTTI